MTQNQFILIFMYHIVTFWVYYNSHKSLKLRYIGFLITNITVNSVPVCYLTVSISSHSLSPSSNGRGAGSGSAAGTVPTAASGTVAAAASVSPP